MAETEPPASVAVASAVADGGAAVAGGRGFAAAAGAAVLRTGALAARYSPGATGLG